MYHSYEVDIHNRFHVLSNVDDDSVFHDVSASDPPRSPPPWHSSPRTPASASERVFPSNISSLRSMSYSSRLTSGNPDSNPDTKLHHKGENLRTLVVNCNGVHNKTAKLANMVGYVDPDILLLSETKLNDSVSSSEFLPANYKGFRRDRATAGGGVMVAIKDTLVAEEVELIDVSTEIIWVKILLKNLHPLYVGSFYRQPSDRSTDQLDELEKSLDYITGLNKNNSNVSIFLGGDFNLGDINWPDLTVPLTSPFKNLCYQLLELFGKISTGTTTKRTDQRRALTRLVLHQQARSSKSLYCHSGNI